MQLERRKIILDLIHKDGVVKNADLAKRFNVNIATIRRDIKLLAEEYENIQIGYGGASLKEYGGFQKEMPLSEKMTQNVEFKRRIAQKAAQLIENGDIIALNAGSTVAMILDYLRPEVQNLTLVTLGFNIMQKAVQFPFVELIVPGGIYRHSSGVFRGKHAEEFLAQITIDKAFLGANAVDSEYGWTHPVLEEVEMNRILMRNSRQKYLVADSGKFDKVSLAKIADLHEFDAFVVDEAFPGHYREFAQENGIKII